MVPMHSAEQRIYQTHYCTLISIAENAVKQCVLGNSQYQPLVSEYDPLLTQARASFVTLYLEGDPGQQLRGCIGSLEAHKPLVNDIAANATAAASRDQRFLPVDVSEINRLQYHIAILSEPESMAVTSEMDLLTQLRPEIDGLILSYQNRRGTFLPSVWQSLPEPLEFLKQLKHKVGLPAGFWSDELSVYRYTTESFSSDPGKQ